MQVKSVKLRYKARIEQIEEKRSNSGKKRNKEASEQERLREHEGSTNNILMKHGLWQSEIEIKNLLE